MPKNLARRLAVAAAEGSKVTEFFTLSCLVLPMTLCQKQSLRSQLLQLLTPEKSVHVFIS